MRHCLDSRFTLSKDKYNWILIDIQSGAKDRRHYFKNIKQLSNFIGEFILRENLDKCQLGFCNKSPLTPSYSSVIEEIIGKLEHHIDSIIKESGSAL